MPLSPKVGLEVVYVSYVDGHGVLAMMPVTTVDKHGVLSLVLRVTELPAGVDGHGVLATLSMLVKVMSVTYVAEDISASYVDGHGMLVTMLVSSVN